MVSHVKLLTLIIRQTMSCKTFQETTLICPIKIQYILDFTFRQSFRRKHVLFFQSSVSYGLLSGIPWFLTRMPWNTSHPALWTRVLVNEKKTSGEPCWFVLEAVGPCTAVTAAARMQHTGNCMDVGSSRKRQRGVQHRFPATLWKNP